MVNFLGIIVAAIYAQILGSLWYGPLFGKKWVKLTEINIKKNKNQDKSMLKLMLISFIMSILTASVFSILFNLIGISSIVFAVYTAFLIWLGFVTSILIGSFLWEGKSIYLWILNSSYWLINFLGMAMIISFLR